MHCAPIPPPTDSGTPWFHIFLFTSFFYHYYLLILWGSLLHWRDHRGRSASSIIIDIKVQSYTSYCIIQSASFAGLEIFWALSSTYFKFDLDNMTFVFIFFSGIINCINRRQLFSLTFLCDHSYQGLDIPVIIIKHLLSSWLAERERRGFVQRPVHSSQRTWHPRKHA